MPDLMMMMMMIVNWETSGNKSDIEISALDWNVSYEEATIDVASEVHPGKVCLHTDNVHTKGY